AARRRMRAARYLNVRVHRRVGLEDQDLIERVQAGMGSSSFTSGPFGRNEVCLRGLAARMRETIPVSRLERRRDGRHALFRPAPGARMPKPPPGARPGRAPAVGTVAQVNAELRATSSLR